MTYHSNAIIDIEEGFYVDAKKRKWTVTRQVGRWKHSYFISSKVYVDYKYREWRITENCCSIIYGEDFTCDTAVRMIYQDEVKIVEPEEFKEYLKRKSLVKL